MSGFCINCDYHSIEKDNVCGFLPDNPVNLKSRIFFSLMKEELKKKMKKGILCCSHPERVITDFTTGITFHQPCSLFNTEGQCPLYYNPEEYIPGPEEIPSGDTTPEDNSSSDVGTKPEQNINPDENLPELESVDNE